MTNQQELDPRQEEIEFYKALIVRGRKAVDKAFDAQDRALILAVILMAHARLKRLRGE